MDSRDSSIHSRQGIIMPNPPPYAYHPQHQHLPSSNLMPNPTYGFNSVPAQFDAALLGHHQQQHQHQSGSPSGGAPDAEPGRRRRGRPRKYSPDCTGLVLSSNSVSVAAGAGGSGSGSGSGSGRKEHGEVNGEGSQGRRQRGRPPGAEKKQLDAMGGAAGTGFTPHVIKVKPNEDIVSKMVKFCQEGPRTILILSAFGAVSNPTIRLPGPNDESGTVCYEGCCNILSLDGPFFCMNYDGSRSNNFELTVILSVSDCKASGGRVVGKLIASTTVQIIAASFITEPKKSNGSIPPASSPLPTSVSHMLAFGSDSATANGTAAMEAATDSSDDNGDASGRHPLSHTHTRRAYGNINYPMHSMPMYQAPMGWGNSVMGRHHNNNNDG